MTGPPDPLTGTPDEGVFRPMDALSDVLRVTSLTGGVYLEAEFTAPWSVLGQATSELCRPFMVTPQEIVGFHYVLEGSFLLQLEDGRTWEVRQGEAVMLPHNKPHILTSAPDLRPVQADDIIQAPDGLGVWRMRHGGGGACTRIVCGFLGGDVQLNPLLSHLPEVLKIDVAAVPGGDWIARCFVYAAQSLSGGDPGAASVTAKMSELLFVETVRRHLSALPPQETGWLAGLRDPAIGRALSLLHARLNEDWTADKLANEVGMSRSAFAERFTALVGDPPMRYLTNWRMQVAAARLRQTRQTIARIAFDVGYDSEAAFTRAFRRERGAPPATWRRQTAG